MKAMEDAPTNGETIMALFDGDWLKVEWSDRADDGSPYGMEGWSHEGMLTLDLEGWLYPDELDALQVKEGA